MAFAFGILGKYQLKDNAGCRFNVYATAFVAYGDEYLRLGCRLQGVEFGRRCRHVWAGNGNPGVNHRRSYLVNVAGPGTFDGKMERQTVCFNLVVGQ